MVLGLGEGLRPLPARLVQVLLGGREIRGAGLDRRGLLGEVGAGDEVLGVVHEQVAREHHDPASGPSHDSHVRAIAADRIPDGQDADGQRALVVRVVHVVAGGA